MAKISSKTQMWKGTDKKKLYKNMSAYILQGVKQEILATALCHDCQTFALSERPERLTWTRLETAR